MAENQIILPRGTWTKNVYSHIPVNKYWTGKYRTTNGQPATSDPFIFLNDMPILLQACHLQ